MITHIWNDMIIIFIINDVYNNDHKLKSNTSDEEMGSHKTGILVSSITGVRNGTVPIITGI